MQANRILIVSLALMIVGIGTLTVPTADDQVSTLVKDRAHYPAHNIAEERYAAGDRSPKLLRVLYELRSYFGDIEGATNVLEELASEQPKDVNVQMQLAEHYKFTLRIDLYIAVLEKVIALDISQPVYHKLLGYYRYLGNTEAEIRLLERLIQAKRAVPAMNGRLGLLLLTQGKWAQATELLLRFDKDTSLSVRPERLTLFELLLESGRYEEAYERATAWIREWRDPVMIRDMVERFRLEGKFTLAARLTEAAHIYLSTDLLRDAKRDSSLGTLHGEGIVEDTSILVENKTRF
jgi:tetratricopeptide (TPR) repeat protein